MSREYDQIIYNVAISQGFTPTSAKFVVAQARYESSDYDSSVFMKNINTSGMKFVGQSLATRGTLAPFSERSAGCQAVSVGQVGGQGAYPCKDKDHYAKFKSVEDSAKDVIERNYKLTMKGVTPEQLKAATSPEQFASLLKKRGYYGGSESQYAAGLKAKLLRIQVVEFVYKNRNTLLIGIVLVCIGTYLFYLKKRGIYKK